MIVEQYLVLGKKPRVNAGDERSLMLLFVHDTVVRAWYIRSLLFLEVEEYLDDPDVISARW